jgi:hypothetical protein
MKKLILNENQVKKLVYILINEQTNQSLFSVDFKNAFTSGQYNFNTQYEKIVNDNVEKIYQFIKGKNIKNFKLVISSGESQVPNPKGFEKKGSLATKRAQVLKNYLDTVLPNILNMKPVVEISQVTIGTTPWVVGKDNKDDPKYTAEQFIKVNIVLTPATQVTPPEYNRESDLGEGIYFNNYLVGYIKERFVKTTDVRNSGFQDTQHQNMVFTEIKKDTVPMQVIAKYEIPWQWWNKERNMVGTKHITQNDIEKIRTFKKVI